MQNNSINIAPISEKNDQAIGRIIRQVGAEFGAVGEGYGPGDAEVSAMSQHYLPAEGACYLVATIHDEIVGGCGIAPFITSNDICELRKLFLLPESRGLGIGRALVEQCLNFAENQGYRQCYLDSLENMTAAIALYENFGFKRLAAPLPGSPHSGCDVWMLKQLGAR